MSSPQSESREAIQQNIDTIVKLEHEFLRDRSFTERVGDAIGSFAGTMWFVALHVIWFVGWVLINIKLIPFIPPFDPYPFVFLSMIVSLEGVLLSTFVLIKQNRMSRRSDERSQLDLQINLLAERESTKILQLLSRMSERLGLEEEAADAELEQLSQNTAIETIAGDLKKHLPDT